MICPECGNTISVRKSRCEYCGYDLTIYKRVMQISARFYNQGLACAKVRNLSGAEVLLKKSLEMNKRNTDARNLLGLVYFEKGETVAAISEWVISKHFQAKDNAADLYMDRVQENPVKLDTYNQAIRKYNIALEAAKQGTDDLAVLQLRKVMSMHPNFIRAALLLSVLYMKTNELEKARKLLQRVLRIDVSNTDALRYLAEVETAINGGVPLNKENREVSEDTFASAAPIAFEEDSYHEEKPNVMAFVGLLAGILIGISVVFFMIVPGREARIREEFRADEISYSENLNNKVATINSLETRITALETENEELTRSLAEAQTRVEYVPYENPEHAQLFSDLFEANREYVRYLVDKQLKEDDGQTPDETLCMRTAAALIAIDISKTENEEAISYYQRMCDDILPDAAAFAYRLGKELYDNNQYEDALPYLTSAISYDPDYDRPIYYAGRSYQAISNSEQAIYYYQLLLERCPESSLAGYASDRLAALGVQ